MIGAEGQLEHFIDFKSTLYDATLVSFVTKGKVHFAKPIIKDDRCRLGMFSINKTNNSKESFLLRVNAFSGALYFFTVSILPMKLLMLMLMIIFEFFHFSHQLKYLYLNIYNKFSTYNILLN